MASRQNIPPPPLPNGYQAQAPPGMVLGGPPPNRPQQARQPQQYPPPGNPQNYHQEGPAPAYRGDTFINSSTRIHDIRPEKTLSESFCRKELTTYEVYTILPSQDDDDKESNAGKNSKESKVKKNKDKGADSKSKKRNRWAKVQIIQESYPTDKIIEKIHKLDKGGDSITDKKSRLFPNQSSQVTNILDGKIMNDNERQLFEWVLAQLHRVEATNPKTGNKETTSMTIYLKRAPLPSVDVINLYRERQERARLQEESRKAHAIHQHQMQQMNRQMQQQAMIDRQMQQQQAMMEEQQMGDGQYPGKQKQPKGEKGYKPNKANIAGVEIVQDHRPGTPKPKKSPGKGDKGGGKAAGMRVRMDGDSESGSSDDYSNSDYDSDDFNEYDSDGTPHTSTSSRDGRKYPRARRPIERSRERRRGTGYGDRENDFVFVERPRRRSVSYAPDVPRIDRPAGRVNTYGQPLSPVGGPHMSGALGGNGEVAANEAYARGIADMTRAMAAITPAIMQAPAQYPAVQPRMISSAERVVEDSARLREDQRRIDAEEIMRRDALRRDALLRDDMERIARPYQQRVLRDEREERLLGGDRGRSSYRPQGRYVDDERVLYPNRPLSPSVSSRSSAPLSPPLRRQRSRSRSRHWSPERRRQSDEYEYGRRGGIPRLPLDREYDGYGQNPFKPVRRPSGYRY